MDTNISQIEKDVIAAILSALKSGKKTVTYGELSEDIEVHTGRHVHYHGGFNKPLANIQRYCSDCGVPCLSSVVVSKSKSGQQSPGKGFLSCYREVHSEDHRSEEEVLKSEQERCASQDDWSPLLEYCGIASESIWDASSSTRDLDVHEHPGEWYPDPKIYSPDLSAAQWKDLMQDKSIFNESSFVMLGCLREIGGQATTKELAEMFGRTNNWYLNQATSLAERIAKANLGVTPYLDDDRAKWWPILFVGKPQKDPARSGTYVWKLRDELAEALESIDWSEFQLYEKPKQESKNYWWLTASPKIWSFSDILPGDEQTYTIYADSGTPRRVHANFVTAKKGDIIIGYEATPVKKVVSLCEVSRDSDDDFFYFKKIRDFANPVPYTQIKADDLLSQSQFVKNPNGSLFALSADEFGCIVELAEESTPVASSAKVEQYNDEDFLNEVYVSDTDLSTMKRLLERKKNLILQGAPGTGKTYCAKRLAWAYMGEKDNSRIRLVQFHQNTTYDDMMAGYKPSDDGGFEPVAGEFLRFCDKAAHDHEERPWFFIIDEINRANISKVFGEMLMLIETSHRNESVMLPLLGRNVTVPSNLYLIGMMNTADRGLALIDYALRRRFAFFEMEPAFANQRFKNAMETLGNDKLSALVEKVNRLNEEIAKDPSFGTGFRIGHSYFCFDDSVSDEEVRDVIEFELAPLIREYWFDDPDVAESKIEMLRSVL